MFDVEFPGLGLSFSLNRVAFTVFGIEIYWYGIFIALGLLLAVVFAYRRAKDFGIDVDKLIDAVIIGTIVGVLGARLYSVVFSPGLSLADFFAFREGGMAFYGAVIFAGLDSIPLCRWKKIKFRPAVDMLAIGFAIGQGIGRWGNFFNQEAFGVNTSLPWGMLSRATDGINQGTVDYLSQQAEKLAGRGIFVDPSLPVHPTFLYESIACLLGALLLILMIKRRRFDGEIALMYVVWNGAIRAIIEGLRTDSLYLSDTSNIRVSQWLAIISAVAAIALIIYFRIKIKKSDDPAYLAPYVKTSAWQAELAAKEKKSPAKNNSKKKPDDAALEEKPENILDDTALEEDSENNLDDTTPEENPENNLDDPMPEENSN